MPPRRSAGILLFRRGAGGVEVLLGHMGGPLWARKDEGAWSAPKGLLEPGEDDAAAARREFAEELGVPVPSGSLVPLGETRLSGGKRLILWAVEGSVDPSSVVPGTFELEWPPRSGRMQTFPEIDRAAWFGLDEARVKLTAGQRVFVDRLWTALDESVSHG